jgi:hypothetical protein
MGQRNEEDLRRENRAKEVGTGKKKNDPTP